MLIVIGKTASGKTTVVNELVKNHGFKQIITYTTRPIREGEITDATYHYISDSDFIDKIEGNFFLEYKKYDTTEGVWYYGSAWEDFKNADNKTVIILTPDGYSDFVKNAGDIAHKAVYIYANSNTIKNRLQERGDNKAEADRRILHDNRDFKGVEKMVDKIVYNNDGTDIQVVIENVIGVLEG